MNKTFILFKLFIAFFFVTIINANAQEKKVMIMKFTGHKAGHCPNADQTISNLINTYGNKIIPINIHYGFFAQPNTTGTEYTYNYQTIEGDSLGVYFGVESFPIGVINSLNNSNLQAHYIWTSTVQSIINDQSQACISINNNIDSNSLILNISVNISFLTSQANDIKIAVYLIEDSIISTQLDYSVTPTTVYNYIHNYVFRKSLNGAFGQLVSQQPIQSGNYFEFNNSIVLDSVYNINNLCIICFLYDNVTKTVLQTHKTSVLSNNQEYCISADEICLVTVDSITEKNMILWNKNPNNLLINHYVIERESSVNVYDAIGFVPYDSISVFIDNSSNPYIHANKYRLKTYGVSNNEIGKSKYHKTINLNVIQGVPSSTIVLNWNHYEIEGLSSISGKYYIFKGSNPSQLQLYDSLSASFTTYNDMNVFDTYYYSVGIYKPAGCSPTTKNNTNWSFSNIVTFNTGIEDIDLKIVLSNSPNPFKESTTIKFYNSDNKTFVMTLTDTKGRVVRKVKNVTGSEIIIERKDLKAGVYFMELKGDSRTYRGKIMIE